MFTASPIAEVFPAVVAMSYIYNPSIIINVRCDSCTDSGTKNDSLVPEFKWIVLYIASAPV